MTVLTLLGAKNTTTFAANGLFNDLSTGAWYFSHRVVVLLALSGDVFRTEWWYFRHPAVVFFAPTGDVYRTNTSC